MVMRTAARWHDRIEAALLMLEMGCLRILHRDDVACFHQQTDNVLHSTHFANCNPVG